mmetsp:Transcript_29999/g.73864  ORF Transcript_29999/g.73864 Transcript_29999/m.73864 type:complete len:1055 (+) Transcript_29999:13-3177(+)
MTRVWIVAIAVACLAGGAGAFVPLTTPLKRPLQADAPRTPFKLRMGLDPSALADTLPVAGDILQHACGAAGACLASVAKGVHAAGSGAVSPPPWSFATLEHLTNAVAWPAKLALQPVTDAFAGVAAALPGGKAKEVVEVAQSPPVAASRAIEMALQPVQDFVAPLAETVADFIHEVSNDIDRDLFNGYPFNPVSLGLWGASVVAFSNIVLKDDEVPYGPGDYDPVRAERYFNKRWGAQVFRQIQILTIVSGVVCGLIGDKFLDGGKNWKTNMPARAKECLKICTRLGTTAIKLGQALSIRTDLLPEPYVRELSNLQDRVAPFPTEISRQILKEELGLTAPGALEEVFAEISEKPVASASIGQVYKGKLHDGSVVAIKVQRPNVIQGIALDLHVARQVLPFWKRLFKIRTDVEALVDEWGTGFVNELDYVREADNGRRFLEAMESRGLDAVTTAATVPGLCSGRVLTTVWIDGERLEKSQEDDVGRLCGVALNAYLTMLLDTGLLHCDPHPGNLMRTTDGRLAILDWGMTVEVAEDLQYTLLEYIAHLTAENWQAVPYDLIKLGFVPEGREEEFTRAGVIEVLSILFKQLAEGGGPKQIKKRMEEQIKEEFGVDISGMELKEAMQTRFTEMAEADAINVLETAGETVNVASVAAKMDELQQKSDVFQIPPWMAYILRTFTVLEGVGLNQDPSYSIIEECFPFLARRLLTDDSPRAQGALREMLYGPEGAFQDAAHRRLDVERLRDLSMGFSDYTVSTTAVDRSQGLDNLASQVTDILLAPEGNFVQQVLIEELVSALDAGARQALWLATKSRVGSFALNALRRQSDTVHQMPPSWRLVLTPVWLPGELALSTLPLLEKDEEDEASLETARALFHLIQERSQQGGGSLSSLSLLAAVPTDLGSLQEFVGELTQKRVGISAAAARFGAVLLARVADRVEEKLEDPLISLPRVTRQLTEIFVDVADRLIDELELVAERQGGGVGAGDKPLLRARGRKATPAPVAPTGAVGSRVLTPAAGAAAQSSARSASGNATPILAREKTLTKIKEQEKHGQELAP